MQYSFYKGKKYIYKDTPCFIELIKGLRIHLFPINIREFILRSADVKLQPTDKCIDKTKLYI